MFATWPTDIKDLKGKTSTKIPLCVINQEPRTKWLPHREISTFRHILFHSTIYGVQKTFEQFYLIAWSERLPASSTSILFHVLFLFYPDDFDLASLIQFSSPNHRLHVFNHGDFPHILNWNNV